MIRIERLDSGTRVIMETLKNTDTVSAGFWFLNGSRDEETHECGYTHFLEHMLFKGTNKRSAFQIAREIDRVGGVINAFTEKENSCYYCTVAGGHLHLALDILADMVFASNLDPAEIEKEKTVILNEISTTLDTPEELAYDLFIKDLWKQHSLSNTITGTEKDVTAVTRGRLLSFYRDKYMHSDLVIAIAGNFDAENTLEYLKELLAPVKRNKITNHRNVPVPNYRHQFLRAQFNQVQIYTGTQLPALTGMQDFYTLLVLSTLIGEALSSRLFQKIREEMGLCYSIFSFRTFYSDVGLWMIYSSTTSEYVMSLLTALNGELKDIRRELITAQELEDARSHLKGNLVLVKEDMETRMKRLTRTLLVTDKPVEFETSFDYIDRVTLDKVNELMENILQSTCFHLLTLGNSKKIQWKGFRFDF